MSNEKTSEDQSAKIKDFLHKAFWLCENSPGICRRSQICQWLVYCIQKNGDSDQIRCHKSEAINRVLNFFELRQREVFEEELIGFIRKFSQHAPTRLRECSSRIESGTDWGRTYQKSLIESPGRLCSFVNYSRKYELDYATRNFLLFLAWDMGRVLQNFAELIDNAETARNFRERAKKLMDLRTAAVNLRQQYYSEHIAHTLRQTQEGRHLADGISRWIFYPEWHFKYELQKQEYEVQFETAAHLLIKDLANDNAINLNDLFEVVAIITSIQTMTNDMGFKIDQCNIDNGKPMVILKLYNENETIFCRIQKNFTDADGAEDQLTYFRTVNNKPRGLQPDIVYKFEHSKTLRSVYLIGDAKNYSCNENTQKINYPTALYAMLHYLIAYRKKLNLSNDLGWLDSIQTETHKRIVLFFPENSQDDEMISQKKPQPGKEGEWHPILFVYGTDAEDRKSLKTFFEDAIKSLTNEVPNARKQESNPKNPDHSENDAPEPLSEFHFFYKGNEESGRGGRV